jgi:hypothetical protein
MVEVKKMMVATRNARGPQPHILLFIHPKVPFLVGNFVTSLFTQESTPAIRFATCFLDHQVALCIRKLRLAGKKGSLMKPCRQFFEFNGGNPSTSSGHISFPSEIPSASKTQLRSVSVSHSFHSRIAAASASKGIVKSCNTWMLENSKWTVYRLVALKGGFFS